MSSFAAESMPLIIRPPLSLSLHPSSPPRPLNVRASLPNPYTSLLPVLLHLPHPCPSCHCFLHTGDPENSPLVLPLTPGVGNVEHTWCRDVMTYLVSWRWHLPGVTVRHPSRRSRLWSRRLAEMSLTALLGVKGRAGVWSGKINWCTCCDRNGCSGDIQIISDKKRNNDRHKCHGDSSR